MSTPPDVRALILTHAIRLFGEQGFAATSVREIVEAAGVTKPTLYYWFENKDALLREAVHQHVSLLESLCDAAVARPGTARERLQFFLEVYLEGARLHPEGLRLMLRVVWNSEPDSSVIDVEQVGASIHERLGRIIDDGVRSGELDASVDAFVAVNCLLGAANVYHLAFARNRPVPPDVATRILDLLHCGWRAPCAR